jgi:hypothetical protein
MNKNITSEEITNVWCTCIQLGMEATIKQRRKKNENAPLQHSLPPVVIKQVSSMYHEPNEAWEENQIDMKNMSTSCLEKILCHFTFQTGSCKMTQ